MSSPSQAPKAAAFAPSVRNALRAQGKTGKDLAQAIGVSENTVSSWLSERHQPKHGHVLAVAQFLQVGLEELGGRTEPIQDHLVTELLELGIDEELRRLARITPDLLRILDAARERSGS